MHRSWENYKFIKRHASDDGPYEVSQLLATFMFAVAHPREQKLKRQMNDLLLEDANQYFGLPFLNPILFEPRQHPRRRPDVSETREFNPNLYLGDQIEIIRNAIAHGNINFSSSDASEDISEIRFLNIHRERERDSVITTFVQLEAYTRVCIEIADFFFHSRDLGRSVLRILFPDGEMAVDGRQ